MYWYYSAATTNTITTTTYNIYTFVHSLFHRNEMNSVIKANAQIHTCSSWYSMKLKKKFGEGF